MTNTGRNTLIRLRSQGWSVAVHNDYNLRGADYTFWLFTHPSGVWAKGEGGTDDIALEQVAQQVLARTTAQGQVSQLIKAAAACDTCSWAASGMANK